MANDRLKKWSVGAGLVAIGAVLLASGVAIVFGPGDEITRAAVPADGEVELTFEMPAPRVELYTEISVSMSEVPTDGDGDPALPHALDYAVRVYADGELIHQAQCRATEPRHYDYTSLNGFAEFPKERYSYMGRLEGCGFDATPGQSIRVTARSVFLMDDYRELLEQSDIAAKLPGWFEGC